MPKLAEDFDIVIGKRIRLQRLLLGLSQSELAQRLDVSYQQVQKYERATSRMTGAMLIRVGLALNIPLSDLLRSAPEDAAPPQEELVDSLEALELLQAFKRIESPRARVAALELIRVMAKGEGD